VNIEKPQLDGGKEQADKTPASREGALPPPDTAQQVEQLLTEKLSTRLTRELAGIATVRILEEPKKEGERPREILQIDITNREKWQSPECQRKFLPLIGVILQQTFFPEKDPNDWTPDGLVREYHDCDPDFTDRIILLTNGQRVTGFSMVKKCNNTQTDNIPVVALQLRSVEAGKRYKGTGAHLIHLIRQTYPDAIIISATHTPAAVTATKRHADASGEPFYFCGYRNGDSSLINTPAEEHTITEAEESYRDMLRVDYGGLDEEEQKGIPPHCVNYGEGSISWTDDHQWKPGDTSPIAATFNQLRKSVFDQGRQQEGIYGMATVLPKNFLTKKVPPQAE